MRVILWGNNFVKYFCVLQFLGKIRKIKMAAIFWWGKIFLKIGSPTHQLPCRSKISSKSLYLARFSRDKQRKNSKIQNGRHFWQVKYSLKLGKTSLHRYPAGQKFCRSHSIYGFRDTSIFVFCDFGEKFKMAAIFGGTKSFLKTGSAAQQRYPVGQKLHRNHST